jgi:flagellar biosynthesis/type III secretory pathway protein FliH
MTTTNTVPMHAPLVGLRLHARRPIAQPGAAAGGANPAQRLLDLHEMQQRREAAVTALRELATASRRAVEALPQQVGTRLDDVAALAVELGLALANEIVGDALQKGIVDPTPTVVRCLRDCVHGSSKADLVVRLHPDDLALVQTTLHAHPEVRDEAAAARFVADPTISRGGVRAETGAGRLQYDPREVLQRICDEVRREATA